MSKYIEVMFVFFFKIILEIFYITQINKIYFYEGLTKEIIVKNYILGWIIYMMMYFFLKRIRDLFIEKILHLEFIFCIIPNVVYYGLNNKSSVYMIYITIVFCLQIFLLCKVKKSNYIQIDLNNMRKITTPIIVIISFIVIGYYITNKPFSGFKSFDFVYIYELRKIKSNRIIGYLEMFLYSAIIPSFFILNLNKKKYLNVLLLLGSQIIIYIYLGNKFILFLPIFLIVMYYVYKYQISTINWYLMGTLVLIIQLFVKSKMFLSLIGERLLFIPALNKFLYYEYFKDNVKIFFSDSLIGKVFGIDYPYLGSQGQIIWYYLFKRDFKSSNSVTGYLGDSYSQMGFLGMILQTLIFVWIIKNLRGLIGKKQEKIFFPLFALNIIMLTDTPLLTTLLSGGFILGIVLLLIYEDEISIKREYTIKLLYKIFLKKIKKNILFSILFSFIITNFSEIFYYIQKNKIQSYIFLDTIILKKDLEKPNFISSFIFGVILIFILLTLINFLKIFNRKEEKEK